MAFHMRKSIKVAPGVRLNVSKSGVGASVGGRGGRYSVHSSGRRTVSAGGGVVPGVYYQKSVGGGRSRSAESGAGAAAPAAPRKPGPFTPKGEKQLYKAIKTQDVQAIKRVERSTPTSVFEEGPGEIVRWLAKQAGRAVHFEKVEPGDEQTIPPREQRELDSVPAYLAIRDTKRQRRHLA